MVEARQIALGEAMSLPMVADHVMENGAAAQFTALVGQTVVAANDLVGAWAMLYAAISGHSLSFVGSLFDKWARESVQRERISKLAREFLAKLPRELEQVETLLVAAEELAHERDMLVNQPWSISYLDEPRLSTPMVDLRRMATRADIALERVGQFEALLEALRRLHENVIEVVEAFTLSRDVEKARVLNHSAVLAAEMKFGKKSIRPKIGPRHREWPQSLTA